MRVRASSCCSRLMRDCTLSLTETVTGQRREETEKGRHEDGPNQRAGGARTEGRALRFSERFECKYDGTTYATPEPRLFSFNSPFGACPTCQGFGNTIGLDLDLVIPNPGLTLSEGAIEPWTKPQFVWAQDALRQFCTAEKIPFKLPFNQLPKSKQRSVITGHSDWSAVRGFFVA